MATTNWVEELEEAYIDLDQENHHLWEIVEAMVGVQREGWSRPVSSITNPVQIYWGGGYTVVIEAERMRELMGAVTPE